METKNNIHESIIIRNELIPYLEYCDFSKLISQQKKTIRLNLYRYHPEVYTWFSFFKEQIKEVKKQVYTIDAVSLKDFGILGLIKYVREYFPFYHRKKLEKIINLYLKILHSGNLICFSSEGEAHILMRIIISFGFVEINENRMVNKSKLLYPYPTEEKLYHFFYEVLDYKFKIPDILALNIKKMTSKDFPQYACILTGKSLRKIDFMKNVFSKTQVFHAFHTLPSNILITKEYGVFETIWRYTSFLRIRNDKELFFHFLHYSRTQLRHNHFELIWNFDFLQDMYSFFARNKNLFLDQTNDKGELFDFLFDPRQKLITSFKGLTWEKLEAKCIEWHNDLNSFDFDFIPDASWEETFPLWEIDYEGKAFQIVELKSTQDLIEEAKIMHHCVATYADYCIDGNSKILSLRELNSDEFSRLITIEIVPHCNEIAQMKGKRNRWPNDLELNLIDFWCKDFGLDFDRKE